MKDIVSRFGEPQSAYYLPDMGNYILAYQNNPAHPHRFFFGFDHAKVLDGKSYEPLSVERTKLFKELKEIYKDSEFYSPPVSMCGSHFPMNDGLVYILGTGVTLRLPP